MYKDSGSNEVNEAHYMGFSIVVEMSTAWEEPSKAYIYDTQATKSVVDTLEKAGVRNMIDDFHEQIAVDLIPAIEFILDYLYSVIPSELTDGQRNTFRKNWFSQFAMAYQFMFDLYQVFKKYPDAKVFIS